MCMLSTPHAYTVTYSPLRTYTHVHTHTPTHTYTHTHTYLHPHPHTHTHTQIHIHTIFNVSNDYRFMLRVGIPN